MNKLPKWFKVEIFLISFILLLLYIISSAITIVPWGEKYRYYAFYILSGISLIILLISFLKIKLKKK